MAEILRIVLDLVVLAGLGVTLYYALRLKTSLDLFRTTRKEFDSVMRELARHTAEAFRAVESLREATEDNGAVLQRKLNEAKTMISDLDVLNGSADALAHRLEALAEKNRRLAQGLEDPGDYSPVPVSVRKSEQVADKSLPARAPFVIRDREMEDAPPVAKVAPDFRTPDLRSQAERDLFEALQKSQRSG